MPQHVWDQQDLECRCCAQLLDLVRQQVARYKRPNDQAHYKLGQKDRNWIHDYLPAVGLSAVGVLTVSQTVLAMTSRLSDETGLD